MKRYFVSYFYQASNGPVYGAEFVMAYEKWEDIPKDILNMNDRSVFAISQLGWLRKALLKKNGAGSVFTQIDESSVNILNISQI